MSIKKPIDWSKYNNSCRNGAPKGGSPSPARSKRIDKSLAKLVSGFDGTVMSLAEIARECGTSKAAIQQIEMKAMKRLRFRAREILKELEQ